MNTNQLVVLEPNENLIPLDTEGNPKYTTISEFNKIMQTNPRKEWIETQQGLKYLTITAIRDLLTELFPFWQVIPHGEPKLIANSVVVSVELKVFNPLINQWMTYYGVGAQPLQTEKNASPTAFDKIKHDSVHKAVGAAKSYAVKNAAKDLGRLFGQGLNNRNKTNGIK